jgi:SNF2 family DNA or RNA helicase
MTKTPNRRIALDECQEIRSSTTALAKQCAELVSDMRWMISGTPLHSSVDDLNGELSFLQVRDLVRCQEYLSV